MSTFQNITMEAQPEAEPEPAPAPVLEEAKLKQYYEYENRLASFVKWPFTSKTNQVKPNPEALAQACFFYYPDEPNFADNVACPYCHLYLDTLEPQDDPMQLHKKLSPMCRFLLKVEVENGETIICAGSDRWNITKEVKAARAGCKGSHTKSNNKKKRPKAGKQPENETETNSG